MKLLIVDDHEGMRTAIRRLAALPDNAVRECASGEKAIGLAREFSPDVVVMDVRLPGLSGLEAARSIHVASPNVSIVVVSSWDLPGLRKAALDVGAVEFLAKVELDQLSSILARISAAVPNSEAPSGAFLSSQE